MKIAVIGAGGRTGVEFVQTALAAGHEVNAGIHSKNPFKHHHHLNVIRCDSTSIDDVRRLLRDQDAVVSLIGHVQGSPINLQTQTIDTVIDVMNEYGIKRLISLTGTGVRFGGDEIPFIDRLMNAGISFIDPIRVKDGNEHADHIKKTNLDWSILRVLKLQNIPTKPYTLTKHGPTKIFVGRKEVAKAILEMLELKRFFQKAPMLSHVKTTPQ
jgi:nucleoside-diphosphate-sugar epimerase